MSETFCPACGEEMERQLCAPCYDCGHLSIEIDHFNQEEHEYSWLKVFDQEIILCDFCDPDFGSYYPKYFGLKGKVPIDYKMQFLKKIYEPSCEPDFVCKCCNHRMKFIKFLIAARAFNSNGI